MNKYLAAISPTHIYVVHATIEDGVGAFLRTYTSTPKFQALEKIPFDSFDEANEHLSQIENLFPKIKSPKYLEIILKFAGLVLSMPLFQTAKIF